MAHGSNLKHLNRHRHCRVRAAAYPGGPWLGGSLVRWVLCRRVGSAAAAAAAGPGALSQPRSGARGAGAPSHPALTPILPSPPLGASPHPPTPRPALPCGGRVPANHSGSGRHLNNPRNRRRPPTPPPATCPALRATTPADNRAEADTSPKCFGLSGERVLDLSLATFTLT